MMTKEEAIEVLYTMSIGLSMTEKEAINMALEALINDEGDVND